MKKKLNIVSDVKLYTVAESTSLGVKMVTKVIVSR